MIKQDWLLGLKFVDDEITEQVKQLHDKIETLSNCDTPSDAVKIQLSLLWTEAAKILLLSALELKIQDHIYREAVDNAIVAFQNASWWSISTKNLAFGLPIGE